jgi:hypothetical protein
MPRGSHLCKGDKFKAGFDVHKAAMNQVEGCVVCPFTFNVINLELYIRWNP